MRTTLETAPQTADLTMESLRLRLDELARTGSPAVRGFAAWLADQPEELAFHSVRTLAQLSGADPNVVVRCIKAAGFGGFAQARQHVQNALRQADQGYGSRAGALQQIQHETLVEAMAEAAQKNTRRVFTPSMVQQMDAIVTDLLAARRVHCIGVRIAYALAHYFTYRGGIAHANVLPSPSQPGLILDSLITAGPEDIVVVISFAHYSAEVLRAAAVAQARGARILALTDRRDSPLASGAWQVLRAPVDGPNIMYSIVGAMTIIETLLELMAARDPLAQGRIEAFETGLLEVGAYARAPAKVRP